jgi:hypothetical protein
MDADLGWIRDDLGVEAMPPTVGSWQRGIAFNADMQEIPYWYRTTYRRFIHRYRFTHVFQTCSRACPWPYTDQGGNCAKWNIERNDWEYTDHYHRVSTRHDPPEVDEWSWTEESSEYRFDPPWFHKFVAATEYKFPGILGLPGLTKGDVLRLGSGAKNFDVSLNGEPRSPTRAISSARLPIGLNLLELEVAGGPHKGRLVQLPFSVVPSVELVPIDPVVDIRFSQRRNGGDVAFRLKNLSHGEKAVRLETASAPQGWMALVLGDPVRVLKAGKQERVKLRVEQMNPSGEEADVLPFSVRLQDLGGTKFESSVTGYVRPIPRKTKRVRTGFEASLFRPGKARRRQSA